MSDDENDELEKILLHGISIPSPPQLLVDVQMEMLDPDPSLDRITDCICADPGISGGILKTLRSPFYGLGDEDVSIRQAVLLLGMKTVFNIINMLSLRSEALNERATEEQLKFLNRFWDSSTDIAVSASIIASRSRLVAEDNAYLLGLFSNAGIALMTQRFEDYPEVMAKAYSGMDERIVDTENQCFDTNHAVLGYYMAKSWKVPKQICEVIRVHHNAHALLSNRDEQGSPLKDMLAILKLAEHFSCLHKVLASQNSDVEWDRISEDVLFYLGLSEDDYKDIESFIQERGIGDAALL